jgi:hypothetical protein
MRTHRLKEFAVTLIFLCIVIHYIYVTIQPWIPYILAACGLICIGWVIYTRLKRL